jgi:hypothetical protein
VLATLQRSLLRMFEGTLYVLWSHALALLRLQVRAADAPAAVTRDVVDPFSAAGIAAAAAGVGAGAADWRGADAAAEAGGSGDLWVAVPSSARLFIFFLQDTIVSITRAYHTAHHPQSSSASGSGGGTAGAGALVWLPPHVYLAAIEAADLSSRAAAGADAVHGPSFAAAAAAAAAAGASGAGAATVGLLHAAAHHYGVGVDTVRACAKTLEHQARVTKQFADKLLRLLHRDVEPVLTVCDREQDPAGPFAFARAMSQATRKLSAELLLRAEIASVTRDVLTKACEDLQTNSSIFM